MENDNIMAIAIIDASTSSLCIYDVPSVLDSEGVEHWIVNNTDHKLSQCSWGEFDGTITDNR